MKKRDENTRNVLIVEDGDEYLHNLQTFVGAGIEYQQAKDGKSACAMVHRAEPDLVYLDMRFDRTPIEDLLGDFVGLTERFNGDLMRARHFQQDNQGLFILRALRDAGYLGPVILSYDFSGEMRRLATLCRHDNQIFWCPDYADVTTIRETMQQAFVAGDTRRASQT